MRDGIFGMPDTPTQMDAATALARLQSVTRKLNRAEAEAAAIEAQAEEDQQAVMSKVMTAANDLGEDLGGGIAGLLAAADLPFNGESIGIAIGGIVQFIRPFTDPNGGARLATSVPQGMMVGGVAIATMRSRLKKKGYTIAPATAAVG